MEEFGSRPARQLGWCWWIGIDEHTCPWRMHGSPPCLLGVRRNTHTRHSVYNPSISTSHDLASAKWGNGQAYPKHRWTAFHLIVHWFWFNSHSSTLATDVSLGLKCCFPILNGEPEKRQIIGGPNDVMFHARHGLVFVQIKNKGAVYFNFLFSEIPYHFMFSSHGRGPITYFWPDERASERAAWCILMGEVEGRLEYLGWWRLF